MIEFVRRYKKNITAALIRSWWSLKQDSPFSLSQWEDLRDDFGATLPFFSLPSIYAQCPFAELGIPNVKLSNLSPSLGEAWVLFCYTNGPEDNGSPLRGDGFMLILEWRRDTEHSQLLPESLQKLADQVLYSSFRDSSVPYTDIEKWGLHPSFKRFSDNYNFSDEALFGGNVGSAWGALATGLKSALTRYVPASWPFCSIQFDPEEGRVGHVNGIKNKLAVAAAYNCREFVVAPCQVREATQALSELEKRQVQGCGSIHIIPADSRPEKVINSILYSHLDWLRPMDPLLEPHPEFIGRQWLIDQILSEKADQRTTVIYGLPGTGKSALLNKVADIKSGDVLAFHTCSRKSALEFIKAIAYQIALRFPEAFREAGVAPIRELACQDAAWDNLKKFCQAAVIAPLKICNRSEKKPLLIIIDALDEAQDRNVAKLLSEADTQLPDSVRVIVSSRPLQDIRQILGRIPLQVIDLDSNANCRNDLSEYIQHWLSQPQFAGYFKGQNGLSHFQVFEAMQRKATNYGYIQYSFLNIQNGTYTLDQLDRQLPDGVQGHYLAFFDSHLSKHWNETKPILEVLVASTVPLSRGFADAVLDKESTDTVARLRGYIVEQGETLHLCDTVFRDWLIDQIGNPDFFVDPESGHYRLAEYGWPFFCKIISEFGESDLSGKDFNHLKQSLPMELQETLGHYIAHSGFPIPHKQQGEAAVLLSIMQDPDDKAAITNAIRRERKALKHLDNITSKSNGKSTIAKVEHIVSGAVGGVVVLEGSAIAEELTKNDRPLDGTVRNETQNPLWLINTRDLRDKETFTIEHNQQTKSDEAAMKEANKMKLRNIHEASTAWGEPGSDATSPFVAQFYPDTCAIRSQQLVLSQFGINVSQEELIKIASENGWYNNGTPMFDVGKLLNYYNIETNMVQNANVFTLSNEIAQGHRIIVGVDSGELWHAGLAENFEDMFEGGGDHALVVVGIDTSDPENITVQLMDPGTGHIAKAYPLEQFMDAWKDSGCFMVSTTEAAPPFASGMENFDYSTGHIPFVGNMPYEEFDRFMNYSNFSETYSESYVIQDINSIKGVDLNADGYTEIITPVDLNQDGILESALVDADGNEVPDYVYENLFIDGQISVGVYVDTDGDGIADSVTYDADGDGIADCVVTPTNYETQFANSELGDLYASNLLGCIKGDIKTSKMFENVFGENIPAVTDMPFSDNIGDELNAKLSSHGTNLSIENYSNWKDYHANMAEFHSTLGDDDNAQWHLNQLDDVNPDDPTDY